MAAQGITHGIMATIQDLGQMTARVVAERRQQILDVEVCADSCSFHTRRISDRPGIGTQERKSWSVLRWPFAFLSMTGSMMLLYAIVPRERLRLRMVWPGAVTFSVLWLLMTATLSAYLSISLHIPRVYGAITGIIMLLLWFYLTSLLLFYGAEVNATWMSMRDEVARTRQRAPTNPQRGHRPNRRR